MGKILSRHFIEEDTQMTNTACEGHSTSLLIREIKLKSQCDITEHSIEWLQLRRQYKNFVGFGATETLIYCW